MNINNCIDALYVISVEGVWGGEKCDFSEEVVRKQYKSRFL